MGKIKLFPTPEYTSKQASDPVVPLVPCTGIFLGPSKSGKTVALISLILEQYKGVFERIYVFSPSVNIDDGWIPVKKYIEQDLGVNTEREQAYWDEWDESALRRIIQQQRKITEASKKLEMKKLYQVLVVIDDFADTPQLHKPHGALDTLFIRGRHMQISTWVSSQKLRLAPHQAQQGAQEDRVSPQVAAVQVCDGLEGVDAAHLQARAPGGEVVLQLSRTEEGRVKHGDVPQQPVQVRS